MSRGPSRLWLWMKHSLFNRSAIMRHTYGLKSNTLPLPSRSMCALKMDAALLRNDKKARPRYRVTVYGLKKNNSPIFRRPCRRPAASGNPEDVPQKRWYLPTKLNRPHARREQGLTVMTTALFSPDLHKQCSHDSYPSLCEIFSCIASPIHPPSYNN